MSIQDFIIRPVSQQDVQGILDIYNPFIQNTAITYEEVPLTPSQMGERIQKTTTHFPWLVSVNSQGVVAGYAYASQHRERASYRWNVDVSVYIGEKFRGMNLATNLYTALFDVLKKQNYIYAFAIISLPNQPSVTLHEKMGFVKNGHFKQVGFKLGKWHDVGWWQLELNKPVAQPAEPIPFSKIR